MYQAQIELSKRQPPFRWTTCKRYDLKISYIGTFGKSPHLDSCVPYHGPTSGLIGLLNFPRKDLQFQLQRNHILFHIANVLLEFLHSTFQCLHRGVHHFELPHYVLLKPFETPYGDNICSTPHQALIQLNPTLNNCARKQ